MDMTMNGMLDMNVDKRPYAVELSSQFSEHLSKIYSKPTIFTIYKILDDEFSWSDFFIIPRIY